MTKAEVFTDPAFLRLSEQQQAFVKALVENGGEKVPAAHEAYNCKDDFTARSLANRCMRKLAIKRLVGAYFGEELKDRYPSREEMAALAWERAQNTDDGGIAHKWAALAAAVLGFTREAPVAEPKAQSAPASTELDDVTLAELETRGLGNGTSK